MDKTVRVGSSRLTLGVVNDRVAVAGILNMPNGESHTFWVNPQALEAALKQLKKARSPRCRSKKPQQP